mmetsp:Transcript_60056/g.137680  ORF Transcript_60056/g.137680 Transcript_60056/m.137680 type:complete len:205 (+) Transcript_60056:382-996(+)
MPTTAPFLRTEMSATAYSFGAPSYNTRCALNVAARQLAARPNLTSARNISPPQLEDCAACSLFCAKEEKWTTPSAPPDTMRSSPSQVTQSALGACAGRSCSGIEERVSHSRTAPSWLAERSSSGWCGAQATPLTHDLCARLSRAERPRCRTSHMRTLWSEWPVAMLAEARETSTHRTARCDVTAAVELSAATSHSRTVPSHDAL